MTGVVKTSSVLSAARTATTITPTNNIIDQNNENACIVCFKDVEIFSIGDCNHAVCYECSTRMRVLCRQNECPICRQDLAKVVFTNVKKPFRQLELEHRNGLYDKKFRICFGDMKIRISFYELLKYRCPKCDINSLPTFNALQDHVRVEHELFYCDLCTENLKIFSFERKPYSYKDLTLHKQTGDADNKSHRGHPLCKFCRIRYLDRDVLFGHMRREHLYCHFCDVDGGCNQFYPDYQSMREHFRNEHYLCEEGDCAHEQFTTVYRDDIDLKAHKAQIHGKSLGKVASKQARTLEFEFTLPPRNRQGESSRTNQYRPTGGGHDRHDQQQNEPDIEQNELFPSAHYHQQQPNQPTRTIDTQNKEEFPSLSGDGSTTVTLRPNVSIRTQSYATSCLARTKENFPALGNNLIPEPDTSRPVRNPKTNNNTASALLKQTSGNSSTENRNVKSSSKLGNGSVMSQQQKTPNGMVIHVSNRPNSSKQIPVHANAKDFPALPGTIATNSTSHRNSNLYDDLIVAPSLASNYVGTVSTKHRLLIDNSDQGGGGISTNNNINKINIIQQKSQNENNKNKLNENVPKLNSIDNFPVLGGGGTGAGGFGIENNNNLSNAPTWLSVTAKKQTALQTDKSKVKSIGGKSNVLITTSVNDSNNNNNNKNSKTTTNNTTKKEKPKLTKDSKSIKMKQQSFEPEFPSEIDFIDISNVVSSKHRSLVTNSYESKASSNSKITLVQQPPSNDIKKQAKASASTTTQPPISPTPIKKEENLSILNSKNNFPALKKSKTKDKFKDNNNNNNNNNNITTESASKMKNIKTNVYSELLKNKNNNNDFNNNVNDDEVYDHMDDDDDDDDADDTEKIDISNSYATNYNNNNNIDNNLLSIGRNSKSSSLNSVTLNSIAKSTNDLTFTTSTGESYSILPTFQYIPPENAMERNLVLVSLVQNVLKDETAVAEFKKISQLFREGVYFAYPYYEHCVAALENYFDDIFPEILTLLPDIGKQQELFLVYSQQLKVANKEAKLKKLKPRISTMEVCNVCKQVLINKDMPGHIKIHNFEKDFPATLS